jgi:hypothetical protein
MLTRLMTQLLRSISGARGAVLVVLQDNDLRAVHCPVCGQRTHLRHLRGEGSVELHCLHCRRQTGVVVFKVGV